MRGWILTLILYLNSSNKRSLIFLVQVFHTGIWKYCRKNIEDHILLMAQNEVSDRLNSVSGSSICYLLLTVVVLRFTGCSSCSYLGAALSIVGPSASWGCGWPLIDCWKLGVVMAILCCSLSLRCYNQRNSGLFFTEHLLAWL